MVVTQAVNDIYAGSRPQGDPNFYKHTAIEAKAVVRWQAQADLYQLGDSTWEVAHTLGY